MTLEEKKAIQTVLLDEMAQHTEDQPTLLIDALLSDQGFQFVHHVLSKRLGMAANLSTMFTHLLHVMQNGHGKDEAA